MLELKVILLGKGPHCSQPLCGLKTLRDAFPDKYDLIVEDRSADPAYNPFQKKHPKYIEHLLVEYRGKRLVFDMNDGYDYCIEPIRYYLKNSDFYFKRSFSPEKNRELLSEFCTSDPGSDPVIAKMKPLGLYYFVTYPHSPINRSLLIQAVRYFQRLRKADAYFTPSRFENRGKLEVVESPKILFYTRLWNPADYGSASWKAQSAQTNAVRCELVRALREKYGKQFMGGIQRSEYAMKIARDLVVSSKETERSRYLKSIKSCDICVSSTGLHMSIPGKVGEYVAAARAIVSEKLFYEVPGNFAEGKNYLSFDGVEDCLEKIDSLVKNPRLVYEMKLANQRYYENYLRPDVLVANALKIVDQSLDS